MLIFNGGLLAVSAYYTPFSILRALGDSKTPLIFLILCSLLNIVLDIIFVVPLQMGVAGAAIATILSQAKAAVLCLTYAYKKVPYMRMSVGNMKPDKKLIVQTMKVGLPTGVQYSLMYVSTIVLQSVVNGFGESTIGSFTSVSQMELLVQQIYAGLGTSMVTYTGQNIGAGDAVYSMMNGGIEIVARIAFVFNPFYWNVGDFYYHRINLACYCTFCIVAIQKRSLDEEIFSW